jgi:hypothetical protein
LKNTTDEAKMIKKSVEEPNDEATMVTKFVEEPQGMKHRFKV